MKQIHDFAVKWCDKFRDPNTDYTELIDRQLADDCAALGFIMDFGHSFSQKYGRAFNKYNELYSIINNVTDIQLLGSAVYSQWRFFNHWAYSAAEIASFESRAWFSLALFRLAALTEDNKTIFQGRLKMIRIVSNNIHNNHFSSPNAEVLQHITIDNNGNVKFDGCSFKKNCDNYEKTRSKSFILDKASTEHLFNVITSYFENKHCETFSANIDNWLLELTDDNSITYNFRGPLHDDFKDLSDNIRDILGMDSLYLFDGNFKSDVINKLTLEYTKTEKIKTKTANENSEWEFSDISFSELLILDRKNGTVEHTLDFGTGRKIFHKYEVEDCIQSLFDRLNAETLFVNASGNPGDAVGGNGEAQNYTITIDYERKPQYIVSGSFDKNGLPGDFEYFAKNVVDFIKLYCGGEIFNPNVYRNVKYRKSEYIVCDVTFGLGCKTYPYFTDDYSIKIGDSVLVPSENDNCDTVAKVVDIKYFNMNQFPLPIEKMKRIICKCANTK